MANVSPLRSCSDDALEAFGFHVSAQDAPVNGVSRTIGEVSLLSLSSSTVEFTLTDRTEHSSCSDFLFLEKGSFNSHDDQGWVRHEAKFFFVPSSVTQRGRFDGNWSIRMIRLPDSAFEGLLTDVPRQVGVFEQLTLLERALYAFLTPIFRSLRGEASAIEEYALEQLLTEMCGAILLNRLGGGWLHGSPREILRDQALALIAQRCADPYLDPKEVAAHVHASLRQLQAVFADAGTTIASEIRRQRARLAHSLLTNARFDALTIEEIAVRSGFGTTMSMRRALSEVYESSPRELRMNRTTRA